MIERYALFDTAHIRERFDTANTILSNFKKRYNSNPAQQMPVIVQRGSERKIEFKLWGFVSKNARDTNGVFRYKTYMVREEDIFKKTSTEPAARTQRCIVPVNGFYSWDARTSRAQPYFIHRKDYEPFGLAGIYSSWATSDGEERGTFAIVTAEAGPSLTHINDRMPVVLDSGDEAAWLNPDRRDMSTVYDIARLYEADDLIIDAVSPDVHSKKIDQPGLITPLK